MSTDLRIAGQHLLQADALGSQAPLGQADAGHLVTDRGLIEPCHLREVRFALGCWWPRCTCGWVGTAHLTKGEASTVPCTVELLLTESAERARRFQVG